MFRKPAEFKCDPTWQQRPPHSAASATKESAVHFAAAKQSQHASGLEGPYGGAPGGTNQNFNRRSSHSIVAGGVASPNHNDRNPDLIPEKGKNGVDKTNPKDFL